MVNQSNFLASLSHVKDVNTHYKFLGQLASRGEIETLRHLFIELSESSEKSIPDWACDAVLERIVEVLALTPGFDEAMGAIQLAAVGLKRSPRSIRHRTSAVVSKIVSAQSAELISRLLSEVKEIETLACVLHESVVRRKCDSGSEVVRNTTSRLKTEQHELACLPATLFDFESAVRLPHYGIGSASMGIPFRTGDKKQEFAHSSNGEHSFVEIACDTRKKLIRSAIKNWEEESNGQTEVRCYSVANSFESFADVLPKLGMDCLAQTDEVSIDENTTLQLVFSQLFSAASSGGAYNYGEYAAYGRLRTWQSLAGLVGWDKELDVSSVSAVAKQCRWSTFCSSNDRFFQVAWDFGIACYNPSRSELTILAATDTD